jgi:hypothetical protein
MTPADEFYMRRNKVNCCNEYGDCRQGRDCPHQPESWEAIAQYIGTALVGIGVFVLFILVVL